ncbi:predicted protein [Naegleria gruberi]|uniref:Predicted protein n=1 Tax=Naegleria gruberi TaxID=5762 RepID=D2VNH3_NAEGR|nr:uncharacterized protein NAEGRDRAFT_70498 [Naegleria gruberi]EFC41733.1 predicted protein [Naegleria gruberi]|eukprot:XP_002674477.1 predicted protein [Naegleria gruberi strain NEG-M]
MTSNFSGGLEGIVGSSPNHWMYGQKRTYLNNDTTATTETLGKGFSTFYTSEFPRITHGDSIRKHYPLQEPTSEFEYKPQIRVLSEPQPEYKSVRKKMIDGPTTEEIKVKRKAMFPGRF